LHSGDETISHLARELCRAARASFPKAFYNLAGPAFGTAGIHNIGSIRIVAEIRTFPGKTGIGRNWAENRRRGRRFRPGVGLCRWTMSRQKRVRFMPRGHCSG
jgi:hypothetical protein